MHGRLGGKGMHRSGGSSHWFERGFVTYSNPAKEGLLGVSRETLVEHGAVSEAVVVEMACGALRASDADIAVAISGIAGPEGGTPDKPVGTVWFAWALSGGEMWSRCCLFEGGRKAVRYQAVARALRGVIEVFAGKRQG